MFPKSYIHSCFNSSSIILIVSLLGCQFMDNSNQKDESKSSYFSSPAKAIPIISNLLENKKFKILAGYYDLSKSDITLFDLESGDFFIRKERPELAHPAELWRYKHPFAPGFKFKNVQATAKEAIYIVEVYISIDQGSDSPEQIGLSYFYMLKSDKGWRILPNQVTSDELQPERPKSINE